MQKLSYIIILLVSVFSSEFTLNAKRNPTTKEIEAAINVTFHQQIEPNVNLVGNEWEFVKVIDIPNYNKDEIFSAAVTALAEMMTDSKDEIKEKDKETGVIVAKFTYLGATETIYLKNTVAYFPQSTITISIKDGKYRIKLMTGLIYQISQNKYYDGIYSDILNFYPYNKDIKKAKEMEKSFDNLKQIYDNTQQAFDKLEQIILKAIKEAEW